MATVWKGTLARGGRVADEFPAEIDVADGKPPTIWDVTEGREQVFPQEVRPDYLVQAIVKLATTGSRPAT